MAALRARVAQLEEARARDHAELLRLKARHIRAKRLTRNPAKALAELGLTKRKPGADPYTDREIEDVVGHYVNWTTSPPR